MISRGLHTRLCVSFLLFTFGFCFQFMANCEASPLPGSILDDIHGAISGDRDVQINFKDGTIGLGPSKKEMWMYSLIGLGVLLSIIGCCICCCRRRQTQVFVSNAHGNPNSSVGYRK